MQVVILAGGYGTRLIEETNRVPKPMVNIGNTPILVHIMNIYSNFGHRDFVVAGGYKFEYIDSYFKSKSKILDKLGWNVNIQDTGLNSGTAGRLLQLEKVLNDDFLLTYGDGLADINLKELIDFSVTKPGLVTVTAVKPLPRFGGLEIRNGCVTSFSEKSPEQIGWINGGFFYVRKSIVNKITKLEQTLEIDVLPKLAVEGELHAFQHYGWWHPMDTLRDKNFLNELYMKKKAPWMLESQYMQVLDW